MSISNDLTRLLTKDTATTLRTYFSRSFKPSTMAGAVRLELRKVDGGTETVVDSGTLDLSNQIESPTLNLASTICNFTAADVKSLLQHVGATGYKHYLKLDAGTGSIETEVSFNGTPPTLSITNDLEAILLIDTAVDIRAEFNRAFEPTKAQLEWRGESSVKTLDLATGTPNADHTASSYQLNKAQVSELLEQLGKVGSRHYLVLEDGAGVKVEKVVIFSGIDLEKLRVGATEVTQVTQEAAVLLSRTAIEAVSNRLSYLRRNSGDRSSSKFTNGLQIQFADSRLDTLKRALAATHLDAKNERITGISNQPIQGGSQWDHWVSGKVIIGKSEDDTDTGNNFDIRVQKLNYGIDQSSGRYIWGFTLGLVKHQSESDAFKVDSSSYSLSGYGIMRIGDNAGFGQFIEAALGYGTLNSDITDLSVTLDADSERGGNSAYASLAYRLSLDYGWMQISPYGRYNISVIVLDAYESKSQGLGINTQDLSLSLLSLGMEASYQVPLEEGTLRPFTQLEYTRDMTDYEPATAYALSNPDTDISLLGNKQSPEIWHFKLGVRYQIRRTNLYLDYERAQSPDHLGYRRYSNALGLGMSWTF